jgi:peptidyl-prolyl cis-trans isomerase D
VFLSVGVNSGQPSGEVAVPVKNRDGEYDAEGAENFVKYGLRRSVPEFVEMQIEETLAQRMRDTVRATVEISPNEIWETFVRESDTVTLDYVRFSPSYYRDEVDPTDADIRAWMDENGEAVDREYQANRHRYTGLEPQVRSRHILVEAGSDASDEVREAARARATALLARARAGEDFAALARQNSDDTASARRGGDLGYNPRGRMVREFDEAQFAMAVDEISDVVETQFGFHVIQVTGTREGDVPEDEAKLELSDRLYREARAEGLAREAAEQALAALAGGMSPSELDDQLAGRTPADEGSPESEEGVDEEVVEEERNPLAPHVEHTRPFGRADTPISGPFDNGPLVRKAFELTEDAPLPEDIVQLGDDFFVFRLAERHRADRDEFDDEVRARIGTGLTAVKQREALGLYVHRLRAEAEAEGAILINDEAFLSGAEPDEEEDDGTGEDEGDED